MSIRVVYNDNICDIVPVYILQVGIECRRIKLFYRESEKKWVSVGTDPVRGVCARNCYDGPERRLSGFVAMQN